MIYNRQSGRKTIEWNCVLETTIKLRIGSFNQLLLGSIQTVFVRFIHDHLLKNNKSTQALVYSFIVRECVWCLSFKSNLFKNVYQHVSILYSTFNEPHPVYALFSINAYFSILLLCPLNSNQFHLMDQTTLKRIVVITLFMLHSFDCLIMICTIQQMTLLSKLTFTSVN